MRRLVDVGHIGVARFAQRRRYANADGIHVLQVIVAASRGEIPCFDQPADALASNIVYIAAATVDLPDLVGINIHAGYAETRFSELDRQRQPDVAQADNTDPRLTVGDLLQQILLVAHSHPMSQP